MKRNILFFCILIIGLASGIAYAGVNEDLLDAAEAGDFETIQALLSRGADVNTRNAQGNTPLYVLVTFGFSGDKIAAMKLLITKGANVNEVGDEFGHTPVFAAAASHDKPLETVKVLVENGAKVTVATDLGETPLHKAAWYGNADVILFLIEKGADVNAAMFDGETPLHEAAGRGETAIVRLLIEKGANVNATRKGETPLHSAAGGGNAETVDIFIQKGLDVNAKDDLYGETPLHKAVKNDQEEDRREIVKLLLEKGADVNAINKNGETPLVVAEKAKYQDVAELLAGSGATAKSRDAFDLLLKAISESPYDYTKRERALEIAQGLSPAPSIPEEAEKHMNRGLAAFKIAKTRQDFEEARTEFLNAATLAPWWPEPYYNLGIAYDKIRAFSNMDMDYNSALENLQFYLKASPNAKDAASVRQKIDEMEYLQGRKVKAEEYINRGAELFNNRDYQGAVEQDKEAVRLYPDYGLAHANLGAAYLNLEKYQEAIPELKEASRLGERVPYVYSNLAFAYKKLGDLKGAISALEEGVRDSNPLYTKGELCQRLGRYYYEDYQYGKALEMFQKALKEADQKAFYESNEKDIDKTYIQEMITRLKAQLGE